MYKAKICTFLTCTCPEFEKNCMLVSCKHTIFAFLFVIRVDDETVSNAQLIGDEDITGMLSKLQTEERFMKRSDSIPRNKNFLQILKGHEVYDKEQICMLYQKTKKSAKCSWCKNVLEVGALAVKFIL